MITPSTSAKHGTNVKTGIRWRRQWIGAISLLILVLGVDAVDSSLTPTGLKEGYITRVVGSTPSAEAFAHAAGEFRIVAANMIWAVDVDHYHHRFMAEGGEWTKNLSLIPFLRLITILDPHFVQAYDVGGAILCNTGQFEQAKQYLSEGVSHNPTEWLLRYDLAMMYYYFRKDPGAALPYALRARDVATDPFYQHRLDMLIHSLRRDIRTGIKIA